MIKCKIGCINYLALFVNNCIIIEQIINLEILFVTIGSLTLLLSLLFLKNKWLP